VLDAAPCARSSRGSIPSCACTPGSELPDDEVGNCRQFANLLRGEAQALGVRFRFHTEVQRIVPGPRPQVSCGRARPTTRSRCTTSLDSTRTQFMRRRAAAVEPLPESADAIVVCAALGSAALLTPHGLKLPLAAVHGYSVTAPLRHDEHHPTAGRARR
jgi:D-amino-acid dehydrogenase